MGCFYKWTTAFCQKELQKAVIMQERKLSSFSVSKLHFMYIVLVLARTGLLIAVARRKHGQDPEVDVYQLTALPGAFQVPSRWAQHGRGSTWVASVDSFIFPVLSATGIVAVIVFLCHCCFH